jgi:hypothetical protein
MLDQDIHDLFERLLFQNLTGGNGSVVPIRVTKDLPFSAM